MSAPQCWAAHIPPVQALSACSCRGPRIPGSRAQQACPGVTLASALAKQPQAQQSWAALCGSDCSGNRRLDAIHRRWCAGMPLVQLATADVIYEARRNLLSFFVPRVFCKLVVVLHSQTCASHCVSCLPQPTGVPLVDELMKLGSVEAAAQRRCAAAAPAFLPASR